MNSACAKVSDAGAGVVLLRAAILAEHPELIRWWLCGTNRTWSFVPQRGMKCSGPAYIDHGSCRCEVLNNAPS